MRNETVSNTGAPPKPADATEDREDREGSAEEWLRSWRALARQTYEATELPHRAAHLWRYTDPALFAPGDDVLAELEARGYGQAFGQGTESAQLERSARTAGSWPEEIRVSLEAGELAGAGWIAGDRLVSSHLDPVLQRAGVRLLDLGAALNEVPHLLKRTLGQAVGPDFGKFEALSAASFHGGVFLHVPRGVVIEKPIHLVQEIEREGFHSGRLAVLVDEGASFTLISEHKGGPKKGSTQLFHVAELILGANSRVQFALVQNFARTVQAYMTQRARLAHSASYVPVLASFGGSLAKLDSGAVLEGDGSQSEMTGFLSAIGKQRFDNHTVHHHLGQHTRSNLDFKTVLKDRSRSAYTGLIRIEKEADYSEAYQENRNLLLSETCRADSIPELEILTQEVQCKHGATVGPLNPEHLFYLMSRAIPRDEAIRIIVEGHFESALRRLPQALQDRLHLALRERLQSI